jgi:group I intron endonuclease
LNTLILREQYYIDILKPEYNILKVAGSRLGAKHSESTKQLLSNAFKGHVFSEYSLDKMRLAAKSRVGNKTSFYGKTHIIETIAKIPLKKFSLIKVIDTNTNTIKVFRGNLEAANYLDMGESTLRRYKRSGKLFKSRYYIGNYNIKD